MAITFTPMKLETIVVLRDGRVIGTIKRYRGHKAVIVSVPGVLSASMAAGQGKSVFRTVAEAKAALLEKLGEDADEERLAA